MREGLEAQTAVLVDAHPLWLDVVEHLVRKLGLDVAAKYTTSSAALAHLDELHPELLITGIEMFGDELDGVALIRESRQRLPQLKAIVLSMYDDAEHIEAAFAAGALAYVVKTAYPDDLTSAVRQAFQHSLYLASGRIPVEIATTAVEPADSPALTRRELEVLQLVAEGHSNAEISKMLWVTEQTVKFHLSNVYRKLNVSNRTEASRWAQLRGILSNPTISATSRGRRRADDLGAGMWRRVGPDTPGPGAGKPPVRPVET